MLIDLPVKVLCCICAYDKALIQVWIVTTLKRIEGQARSA